MELTLNISAIVAIIGALTVLTNIIVEVQRTDICRGIFV